MLKSGVCLTAAVLLLIAAGAGEASTAAPAPVSDSVLIVTVKKDALGGQRIEKMALNTGRAAGGRSLRESQPAADLSAGRYRLLLMDEGRQVLASAPFGYPALRTIPMPMPGEPADAIPPVIELTEPEVTLAIPYLATASVAEIADASGTTLNSRSLRDAVPESGGAGEFPGARSAPDQAAGGGFNLLIMASGYSAAQMTSFRTRASAIETTILGAEPFSSAAAGITVNVHENTEALGCSTGCGGIDRLLCCDSNLVVTAAAASGYGYDEIIVVHNASDYAGGGYRETLDAYKTNSYSTYCAVYDGYYTASMALHEFGHSFGNLCDEYTYGSEGYSYTPCVNCRSNCSDWSSYTSSCQLSCDARTSYYRPADSIMLALDFSGYNAASLKAEYSPDGLEKRLRHFTGQSRTLTVASTYPAVGVPIAISPADTEGRGDGTTRLTRTYSSGASATLTAPTTADGNVFAFWSGCAGTSGDAGEICTVTLDSDRTATANYVRDTAARPTAFALWSRSDTGQAAVWEVDPDTGALQDHVWLHAASGVGQSWLATSYTRVDASTAYVLWTRSDTGQAALWKVDPVTGAIAGSSYLFSTSGVGAPWEATSYVHVSASAGYVLWTRADTGQAALWKVNPATGALLSSAFLFSADGVGGPWKATGFSLVNASTGLVLWTRSDTGQAAVWTIDPATGALSESIYLYAASGVGGGWQATSLEGVDAATAIVLWTRGDTGQAAVWDVDLTLPTGTGQIRESRYLYAGTAAGYPATLVGAPWQATSVAPPNNAPTMDAIADLTVDEDAGLMTVALGGITAGAADGQSVTLTASSSNTALIPDPTVSYASPAATGSLSFTPAGNASGSATITVWISDGQGANSPVSRSFTVTVTAVDDAPTDIALDSGVVAEGRPAGAAVGTLSASDPDDGDTFTHSLVGGTGDADNGSFAIAGDQLQTAAVLDFAVQSRFSVRVRSTDQDGLWTEKSFTLAPPSFALWTRGDTGQAALWVLDPATGALIDDIWLPAKSGVGGPWTATGFQYVNATTAYVLWTRADTGQAALWRVDPGTGQISRSAYLYSRSGVGGPWRATDYEHVGDAEGYVLWTRSDTGQAALWRIDPSGLETLSVLPIDNAGYLYARSGVGGPWQATSYDHAGPAEGYVLWARGDTGQAALWRIDPGAMPGVMPPAVSVYLYTLSGVGPPWLATSYEHAGAAEGFVLWTRADTGQAALWSVNPGTGALVGADFLREGSGVGGPWQATDYVHGGLIGASAAGGGIFDRRGPVRR